VESAADLVRGVIKLTAGVQHGHDDLRRRTPLFRVNIDRNATTVVANGNRFVRVDRHRYRVAMAGKRLIDRVIDNLEDHVVKAGAIIGVTDIHPRPLSDSLQAL